MKLLPEKISRKWMASPGKKKLFRRLVNLLFIGLLILLVVSPDAKAWVLKQFIAVGLYKVQIKETEKVEAVAFSWNDENGNQFSLQDLKGKTVFVNFWATWCPPCRAEMPSLQKLYNKYRDDKRIVFLFMNEDSNPEKAKLFLKKNEYDFPLKFSAGQVNPSIFSGTLPTTVIINKEGKIVLKHEGLGNFNGDSFHEKLESIL